MNKTWSDVEVTALAGELASLGALEAEVQGIITSVSKLTSDEEVALRDAIKKWLEKALKIAREFGPKEFSVTAKVGFPPAVSISLVWPTPGSDSKP